MDTKELLKKYWFIGVVAIALIAFVGVYAADTYKNREIVVDSKQTDGKYVVYSVDGEDVLADDFYNTLYDAYGINISFLSYERAVLKNAYETTSEMSALASNYASSTLSQSSASDIEKSLRVAGYLNGVDDLQEYFVNLQKRDLAVKEFVSNNADKYIPESRGTNGRLIYHILVKTDVETVTDEEGNVTEYKALPTEEQTNKLNEILTALQSEDSDFEYTAYLYSDDGSNQYGGYVGIVKEENKDSFDPFFADAALALKDGEISDVVTSRYGYHIIYNAGSSNEALLEDSNFISDLKGNYPSLIVESIIKKGEDQGFEIVDENFKAQIEAEIGSEAE